MNCKFIKPLFFLFLMLTLWNIKTIEAQSINEGFNDINTLPASGWAQQNLSIPIGIEPDWSQSGPFLANSFPNGSYIACNYNSIAGTGTISNWLFAPNRTFNNGDVISFYTRTISNPTFADNIELRLSTNGSSTNVGASATSVGDFSTLLLAINPTLVATNYPQTWTQYSVTISGLSGPTSGRVAFRYFVTDGGPSGTNSDYIGIDDFVYTPVGTPSGAADLIISEIMYNFSGFGADTVEYIEIYNNEATTVDLTGYYFGEGVSYTFAGETIAANDYFVIAVDSAAFSNTFGFAPDAVWDPSGLANGGEDISLIDNLGRTVDSVDYAQLSFPAVSNTDGYSIVLCDLNTDNNVGTNWSASTTSTGFVVQTAPPTPIFASPGAANCIAPTDVGIAQVFTNLTNYCHSDSIELKVVLTNYSPNIENNIPYTIDFNGNLSSAIWASLAANSSDTATVWIMTPTTGAYNASAWTSLSTDANVSNDTAILTAITVSHIEAAIANNGNTTATASAINGLGAYSYIWDTNTANQTTAIATALTSGNTYCVSVSDATSCIDTACLFIPIVVGPVANLIISEIMYNFPGTLADTVEYIEIYNKEAITIDLTGYSFVEGITHTFTGGTIAPNDYFVIAIDSAAFSNTFGFPADAAWSSTASSANGLANAGEDISLVDNWGRTVDSVNYSKGTFPKITNTSGYSIVLCDLNTDNNDGNNWGASNTNTGIIIPTVPAIPLFGSPGAPNVCRPTNDVSIAQLITDSTNYCHTDSIELKIILSNNSSNLETNIPYKVNLNGNINAFTWDSLAANSTDTTTIWLMTPATGTHNASAWTELSVDANPNNDTATMNIIYLSHITANTSILSNYSGANISCNGANDGEIVAIGNNGLGALNYNWSPSNFTSLTATGLSAGLHTVTITDNIGCTATSSTTLTEPTVVVASILDNGNATATANATGGTGAYSYIWGTNTANQTSATATALVSGNTYCVSVQDANSCMDSTCVSILLHDVSIAQLITDSTNYCHTDSIELKIILSNNSSNLETNIPYKVNLNGNINAFTWDSLAANSTDTTTIWLMTPATGTHNASAWTELSVDANPNNDTATMNIVYVSHITANTSILSNYSGANISCNGANDGEIVAIGNNGLGALNYNWSPSNFTSLTATGLSAGLHTVTVTDNIGCTATSSTTLTEPTVLTTSVLDNGNTTATANVTGGTGAYSYIWGANTGNQTTATASALVSGNTYCVSVQDANSCTDTTCIFILLTGLEENSNNIQPEINIYPSPTSIAKVYVELNLSTTKEVQLDLFNTIGQQVLSTKQYTDNQTIELDLSTIPSGTYIVRCLIDDKTISKKLIIQH